MIDILFLLPVLKDWQMYYSPGIASMSAVLKKSGFRTSFALISKLADLDQILKNNKTKTIGISTSSPTFEFTKKIAKKIRDESPKTNIVCGGIHCIISPHSVINTKLFDAVCVGEGEKNIAKALKLMNLNKPITCIRDFWFYRDNKIIKNKKSIPVDLNLLPSPDRSIFAKKKTDYYKGPLFLRDGEKGGFFSLSRGCLFNCSYCSAQILRKRLGEKSYYRLIKPAKAIKQIQKALKEYHYDYLVFLDDTFSLKRSWIRQFLKLYKNKIKLPFHCQLRVGTFDEKIVKLLKESACDSVAIGVETGNEKIRFKVLNKKITNQQIQEAAKMFKKHQIKICTYNMIGLPGETPKKFRDSVDINASIRPEKIYKFIFYPYYGTKLYQTCMHKQYLEEINRDKLDKSHREHSILKMPFFKQEDIKYYYDNFEYFIDLKKKDNLFSYIKLQLSLIPPSNPFFKFIQRYFC